MSHTFLSAVQNRRSVYGISDVQSVPFEQIENIIETAVKHGPSAFNSQSGRVVLLKTQEHKNLWNLTKETLKKIVPEDQFAATAARIDGFLGGYGTVLFFEDQSVIQGLQENYALYKDNFPIWSQQSSGMLQFIVWTALTEAGLGANLQHYNELIESDIKAHLHLPSTWKLIGQMPFGTPVGETQEKAFAPIETRFIIK